MSRLRLHCGLYALLLIGLLVSHSSGSATEAAVDFADHAASSRHSDHSNGTITPIPTIEAYYLDQQEIILDGVLDDAAWGQADTGWGFRQADPVRFGKASVPTTFKIAYDDDAIYFAVACWEDDMANVRSYLSRRDQIEASDLVSIYIDPYHDRTTGYNFRVNPAGVQQDAYVYDNGNRDNDWNAVWDSEVSSDQKGWYVELREVTLKNI